MKAELIIKNKTLYSIICEIIQKNKKIFVSEADFQFNLAWELKEKLGKYDIVLEYPVNENEKRKYIDIAIVNEKKKVLSFIELKYKTQKGSTQYDGVELKPQQARPLGNYLFLKDVERMENQKAKYCNYSVFLTNDSKYCVCSNRRKGVLDEAFKLYQGSVKEEELRWSLRRSAKTKEKKHWTTPYKPIELNNSYKCDWKENKEHTNFKFLLFKVSYNKKPKKKNN